MKKALLIILAIVVCAVAGSVYLGNSVYRAVRDAVASGCSNCVQVNNGGPMTRGSGTLKTETRAVAPFTAVELEAPADVIIDRTGTQSLSLTTDDNLLDLFTAEVRDGTLFLGTAKDKSFQAKSVTYRITVAGLRAIAVRGSGDVKAEHLEGPTLSVSIAGSGDVRIGGRIDELTLTINGSGDVDAANLAAKRAKVVISGSGDATVNAGETLDVRINGSGNLHYIGSPKLTQIINGSGAVSAK